MTEEIEIIEEVEEPETKRIPVEQEVEKPETKRIPELDENETLKAFIIRIPEKTNKRLNELSTEKEMSKSSLVREAVKEYLTEIDNPVAPNPEATISDENLNQILDRCTTYYGGFEIDGEDGFVALMEANKFKLKDLTPEQWEKVSRKLSIGYSGYVFAPSIGEFAEKFGVLEPSEEQRKWLSTE